MSEVKKTEEILNCPFCGGEATTFPKKFIDGRKFGIMCKETFCCIIPANFNTKEEAIKAWNTRKPMDDILEMLQDELQFAGKEKVRVKKENPLQFDRVVGYSDGIAVAIDIVRKEGGSCD